MSERSNSVRNKIALLRAKFIEQLPLRVDEALHLFATLRANPRDEEAATVLHRILHSLKGTGNSFGFTALGTVSGQGEHLLLQLLESPDHIPPQFWDELAGVLAGVRTSCDALQNSSSIPAQEKELPQFELQAAHSGESGGKLVYICDDEALLVDQLVNQLRCFGYTATGFTDPAELRTAMLNAPPSALIMDINFPGSANGPEVIAQFREETKTPFPVIFLSVRDDFAARLAAVQAGGEAYFRKPVRPLDLVSTLDELTVQKKPEPYRVLVIDDEPEIAAYHSLILQQANMITQQVNKPDRVLDALQEFHPDLVLMDMYMPCCNGGNLAKLIRQMPDYFSLPIVFLSSETDRNKQFSAMRVGAEGFLTKPIQPEELVSAVVIRAERMRALRALMARDSLTGLYNHTTTTQLLETAIANTGRNKQALCFAMIDVDHFKGVNDTYGHPVGDQVLLAMSRVLQQRLRNSDIVGRYGGEEFAVILQDATLDTAVRIIDQLREDFSKVRFYAGDIEFSCTFSAGIAESRQHESMEQLREAADRALYQAKKQGRNRVSPAQHPQEKAE